MKRIYYKFFCRNPRKKLIFYYNRLKKQETKLLQAYLLLQARILTGTEDDLYKHGDRIIKMQKAIEDIQLIMRRNKMLILSLK